MQDLLSVQHHSASDGICIVRNISCLMTMVTPLDHTIDSTSPQQLGIVQNVDVVSENGRVLCMGTNAGMDFEGRASKVLSGEGLVVMPGLVDSYASPLSKSLLGKQAVLRSQGVSAQELEKMGISGPLARSKCVLESEESWGPVLNRFLRRARNRGVLHQEVKTGYCRTRDQLLRQWQFLCSQPSGGASNSGECGVDLHCTFYGANDAELASGGMLAYIEELIQLLPQMAEAATATVKRACAVDVHINQHGFTAELGDKWLAASLQHGFDIMVHADGNSRSGGAELALQLARRQSQATDRKKSRSRVLSVSNARYSTETDLSRLAQAGVGVIVLPSLHDFRNEDQVEATKLRSSGVRVAIGSGYDPLESPEHCLWRSAFLALTKCGFSLPEVLTGITRQGAFALGIEGEFGTVEVGRKCNLLAFSGEAPEDFFNSPNGDHLLWTIKS